MARGLDESLAFGAAALFAPAKAFERGIKLLFGGWDDALAVETDEVFWPSIRASRELRTRQCRRGVWCRDRAQLADDPCPVVIRAEREPVVWLVVVTDTKGNDVGRFDQREFLVKFDADAAGSAAVIVDFENRMSEGSVIRAVLRGAWAAVLSVGRLGRRVVPVLREVMDVQCSD